jgi:hypothetical protein
MFQHRLGNLTLTGYNSTYPDRPFEYKKNIEGGFRHSAVRLNEFVREQSKWTENEISTRTDELATLALHLWPPLSVAQKLINAAKHREMLDLAARRNVGKVKMRAVVCDCIPSELD